MNESAFSSATVQFSAVSLQKMIADGHKENTHYCLFLDIDGTLSDFQDDPEDSFIPENTLNILQTILKLDVPVIAVTGRHVQVAQSLFAPLCIPVAGLHGLDIQIDAHTHFKPDLSQIDFVRLRQDLEAACAPYPQLLIEDKQYSVALHYRQCPELADTAKQIMQVLHRSHTALKINEGKCVIELLPRKADKGEAINTILKHLELTQVLPIFIGDDKTDESGFRTINNHNGISIKVGPGETQAHYRLKDIKTVADFLALFSEFLKTRVLTQNQTPNGEKACLN
ncbi:trehalose-phosphatase [Acinetobacter sp. 272263]|uniref:trehalose-phosphatase n=1 Tax=Acinetobacter sp. 272263 TaxID=1310639 RepID=UPI000452924C|nr:trehalose-phosphatase [Acinetobacter sp. 272263]EXB87571.1 trehalose-phosphatase [Acinetobacter sp. 272263]